MRIAIFTDAFYPLVNGVVTATVQLAEHLARRGHEVIIVAAKPPKPVDVRLHKNIRVIWIPSIDARFYPEFRITRPSRRYLEKELGDVDIVHFQAPFTLGFEAIRVARKLHKPLVGTFHTFIAAPGYLKEIHLENSKVASRLGWRYSNAFYNKCNLVTSPSHTTMEELKKHGCRRPIQVISNGIDCGCFCVKGGTARKEFGLAKRNIVFVGRIAHAKSVDVLVKAMVHVHTAVPDARLFVVGDGPARHQIQSLVEKLHLKDVVTLTGTIQNAKLRKCGLLQAMDIFVTASKTENQPVTLLEAMACGLPIVGADALGVAEMVRPGRNGLLVTPDHPERFADAIILLLQDKKMREDMGRTSFEFANEHGLEKVAKIWEKAYQHVIDEYRKR